MVPADPDREARAALRERQGKGARHDAPNAPAGDLLLARRGAAFLARKLGELDDAALDAPSLRAGWTRRHLIADVSYRARAMAIALKGLREGLSEEEAEWRPDIALAATLPARALRYLYAHSDVHLNVEFRDLRPADWEGAVPMDAGAVTVRGLPLVRALDLWLGAVDLGNGARLAEVPAPVLRAAPDRARG